MSEEEIRLQILKLSFQLDIENNERRENSHRKNLDAGLPVTVFAPKEITVDKLISRAETMIKFVKGGLNE